MRSTKKATVKNKNSSAVYKRSEKLVIFFRRGVYLLLAVCIVCAAVVSLQALRDKFYVRDIVITGNYHLDRDDIIASTGLKLGEPLLRLNLEDLNNQLLQNSWITHVVLKKKFPGTVLLDVKEAVPRALLSIRNKKYLMDETGDLLERVREDIPQFLPVIKDIHPENRKALAEAMKLIGAVSGNGGLAGKDSYVIGLESYGLSMEVAGDFIKVGYGGYKEKLQRWIELEPEIRRRGVPIKYVDLRFKDQVIVKPLKENKKEAAS
ncbi:MAG: FtsQ-type POTRA domain-containing protein [Nitrospira sp.]|nr:FtsQ-type POTRA domain-containing protein [bacterium]MBL7048200.1 FtsQ-type POTRA domain-containing protein [Nitrospira sp.]